AVRLSGAVIGGQLNLEGARISNPAGPALVADYLSTRSNVMLNNGFHAEGRYGTGTIRLVGADIGGRLMFGGGHAEGAGSDLALNLRQTHVGGDVLLPANFTTGLLALTGLTYDGMIRDATLDELLDMFANRTTRYTSQPYFQLAAAHQAAGHERDVRRIHVARQRDLLRRGELDARGRLWHRVTGHILGYGYRPAIALRWWVGALLLSVLLIAGVAGPAGLARTTAGHSAPCSLVAQVGLAINTVTPLVKLDAQANCQIDTAAGLGQAVIVGMWVLQALGWAFVTLFITGFTGLVRRSP
ncbi:MAG TPA: hypothetical protein VH352_18325, partial [Pseudonocardiaceae bacterium]|nr:hypothetical protein [Pseudonocardiaceae bacterium]